MNETLYVSRTGEGAPPLVLLHGFAGTHRVWDGVRAALGGSPGVLAYDLPGHGGSLGFPEAGRAGPAAKAILADLEDRGIDRFHLAGHSFGGAIAALTAIGEPKRVLSLTLFAPGGFGPEINTPLLWRLAEAGNAADIRDCLTAMSGRRPLVAEGVVREAEAMRTAPGQLAMLRNVCGLIARDGRQGVISHEKLAALTMPVHVVWGALDTVLPARQAHDLPPHFVLHTFPHLGHMLPEEAPQEMAHILARALG
ncbi:alpha/beta fold hydrolase [Chelativorans salis]|uniref:Alpha/beta fold hydrolase n=1 Tax=Chelativorans salis TaxID=2978478 RepID=A0ABT2LJJ1_9HYPH|nr:alpha/beta fold hydrolase [Chelativorans sp. EGI FJ00035]MCT7374766.1 alpha/beta fold hydrolase [Chelativorans sp. EGI FJ00035]